MVGKVWYGLKLKDGGGTDDLDRNGHEGFRHLIPYSQKLHTVPMGKAVIVRHQRGLVEIVRKYRYRITTAGITPRPTMLGRRGTASDGAEGARRAEARPARQRAMRPSKGAVSLPPHVGRNRVPLSGIGRVKNFFRN